MDMPTSQDFGAMTPAQEAAFDAKAEAFFRGHRQVPNGRNFRCWNRTETREMREAYSKNYERIVWMYQPHNSNARFLAHEYDGSDSRKQSRKTSSAKTLKGAKANGSTEQ